MVRVAVFPDPTAGGTVPATGGVNRSGRDRRTAFVTISGSRATTDGVIQDILLVMREERWRVEVGPENAAWLSTECRTALLAREYRPVDAGGGVVEFDRRALGAIRELGEEEDGYITDDAEGVRIWIGEDAYELERVE